MQLVPFALNLLLHVHRKDTPMVLHVALLWHDETTKSICLYLYTLKRSTSVAACCITVTLRNWQSTLFDIYNMSVTLNFFLVKHSVYKNVQTAMLQNRSRHFIIKFILWKYFVPLQLFPFPENPLLHVHWKDPTVLLHVALLWHWEPVKAHSSISILWVLH